MRADRLGVDPPTVKKARGLAYGISNAVTAGIIDIVGDCAPRSGITPASARSRGVPAAAAPRQQAVRRSARDRPLTSSGARPPPPPSSGDSRSESLVSEGDDLVAFGSISVCAPNKLAIMTALPSVAGLQLRRSSCEDARSHADHGSR
jgi:hypothetical protein